MSDPLQNPSDVQFPIGPLWCPAYGVEWEAAITPCVNDIIVPSTGVRAIGSLTAKQTLDGHAPSMNFMTGLTGQGGIETDGNTWPYDPFPTGPTGIGGEPPSIVAQRRTCCPHPISVHTLNTAMFCYQVGSRPLNKSSVGILLPSPGDAYGITNLDPSWPSSYCFPQQNLYRHNSHSKPSFDTGGNLWFCQKVYLPNTYTGRTAYNPLLNPSSDLGTGIAPWQPSNLPFGPEGLGKPAGPTAQVGEGQQTEFASVNLGPNYANSVASQYQDLVPGMGNPFLYLTDLGVPVKNYETLQLQIKYVLLDSEGNKVQQDADTTPPLHKRIAGGAKYFYGLEVYVNGERKRLNNGLPPSKNNNVQPVVSVAYDAGITDFVTPNPDPAAAPAFESGWGWENGFNTLWNTAATYKAVTQDDINRTSVTGILIPAGGGWSPETSQTAFPRPPQPPAFSPEFTEAKYFNDQLLDAPNTNCWSGSGAYGSFSPFVHLARVIADPAASAEPMNTTAAPTVTVPSDINPNYWWVADQEPHTNPALNWGDPLVPPGEATPVAVNDAKYSKSGDAGQANVCTMAVSYVKMSRTLEPLLAL